MSEIEIRKLKTADVFLIVDMLKKVSGSTLPKIMKSVTGTDKKSSKKPESQIQLGLLILTELYDGLREDLIMWLASMVSMEKDVFLNSDAEITLDIIEKLSTDKSYNSFFLRAYNLYKKMAK